MSSWAGRSEGLADPVIEVTSLDRSQIFGSNDDWRDHSTADEVLSKDRAPRSTQDAALAITYSRACIWPFCRVKMVPLAGA
ncbi:MAG: hypothetical protein R3F53_05695 [Gammaproteobacteria bacterium]